ncbi:MAG: SAM-dependent methyltransferase [Candidatus Cohnella colombiensis]|uniref:SAM-dependent methyltransferase n=1 Tax=Candidatus Cohnella colombiensis TaxID=3121368 RepID=A0AA95F1K0_9BACL|nr:MAG: SAM-dependent methyltransferase [Cohnella sp.]
MTDDMAKGVDALEQPNALTQHIRQILSETISRGTIAQGTAVKAISFYQYMTLCLYHHEFGYYRSGSSRIGRQGDFYTSAYIGDLMGAQLAAYILQVCQERFAHETHIELLDWGGGTGRLSRQMMDELTQNKETDKQFTLTLIEGNPEHRETAGVQLATYIEQNQARIISSDEAEQLSWVGKPVIVVANELLDAFPVHRIVRRGNQVREWGVYWDDSQQRFAPCHLDLPELNWSSRLQEYEIDLIDQMTFEINLEVDTWIRSLTTRMDQAVVILIDYGDETAELTASHRMDGTLLCYHQHRAHNDPYIIPGEQDLTAHVNFSLVRHVAMDCGWEEVWYGTQKHFLVQTGVMSKLTAHQHTDPFHPEVRRNRAIRQLLLSDGMSELFKVQVLARK